MKKPWRTLMLVFVVGSVGVWFWLRGQEQAYDRPYSLVEDGLHVGSSVKQPPPGTRAVVNLCGHEDPYRTEASLWSPIFEGGKEPAEPSLEWLREAVEFIAEQRRLGRPTYVHCLSGMNRSGAVVTAYLMYEHGWNRDQALAFLQRKREIVQPNPTLMRLLLEWEAALKEARSKQR